MFKGQSIEEYEQGYDRIKENFIPQSFSYHIIQNNSRLFGRS